MKRKISIILALIFIIGFQSCSKEDAIDPNPVPIPPPSPVYNYTSDKANNLNVVYFCPADNPPIADWHRRLSEILLWGQNFYKTEMDRNGYGAKTFGLLKDVAKQRVKIIQINGKLTKDKYQYDNASPIKSEVDAYFALHPQDKTSEHTLIILPNDPTGRIPFYGTGKTCYAKDYDGFDIKNIGSTAATPQANGGSFTAWLGGLFHELGHGLNLPHNREKQSEKATLGTTLMGAGNTTLGLSPTFLSKADCAVLNRNQVFNNDGIVYYGSSTANITEIHTSYDAAKGAIIVSGKFTSSSLVKDVLFFNDPNVNNEGIGGNKDYNAITWVSKPIGTDSFYIEEPLTELQYLTDNIPYEFKVKLVQENGNVIETNYPYTFMNGIPVMNFATKETLSRNGWTVTANSEETVGPFGVTGFATHLIDGNINTIWMPSFNDSKGVPYFFTIDMHNTTALGGIVITNRQNNSAQAAKVVDVETSTDNIAWTKVTNGFQSPQVISPVNIPFVAPTNCRYIKVTIKEAWGGVTQNPAIAEVNAYVQ